MCAPELPPPESSTVQLHRMRRGGYTIVSDDDGREIPEREFARMYRARTGSTEMDWTDHPHVALTVMGTMLGGACALVAGTGTVIAIEDLEAHRPADGSALAAGFFGALAVAVRVPTIPHAEAGSPEEHDLSRDHAETLVNRYNITVTLRSDHSAPNGEDRDRKTVARRGTYADYKGLRVPVRRGGCRVFRGQRQQRRFQT